MPKLSEEHRRSISRGLTGHKRSEREKELVRQRQMGNKIWLGRNHSEESKRKMRESAIERGAKPPDSTGKKRSSGQIENIRKSKMGKNNPNFGKPRSLETRRKISEAQKGEKSHSWRGGLYPEHLKIRNSLEYKLWREGVFQRDGFTCRFCGQVGGRLNADHIKRFSEHPELRFELSNGRTLCEPCHRTTENFGGRGLKRKVIS